jgi:hypothetical protein
MAPHADHRGMTGIFVLVFLIAIGPLAVVFGVDSRNPKDRRSI